jgi:hypothetical protein
MAFDHISGPLPFSPGALLRSRPASVTWIDIETVKVRMPDGRLRWNPVVIGTAFDFAGQWRFDLAFNFETDADWVDWLGSIRANSSHMIYAATRSFDEMVLKGRFLNARRPFFSKRPDGWPGIDDDLFTWENTAKTMATGPDMTARRGPDIRSRDIPKIWPKRENDTLIHCWRDVVDILFRDPLVEFSDYSVPEVYRRVMEDYDYCDRWLKECEG